MNPRDRIAVLHRLLLNSRHPVKLSRIEEELECSTSTARRLIREMRESQRAPIEYCDDPPGYRYTDAACEVSNLWFTRTELPALLALLQLLQSFEPGLLGNLLEPFLRQVKEMMRSADLPITELHRVRLLRVASRPAGPFFGEVASAALLRRRLAIDYLAPNTSRATPREISPQRVSHYRDKWYLDAWCHKQDSLRIFALHRITKAALVDVAAVDVDEQRLDDVLGGSYGIYSGEPTSVARLLFTPEWADRIDGEQWHPAQKGTRLKSGEYLLEIPFHRAEELISDILRYGPEVEVLEPLELREAVVNQLRAAVERYGQDVKKRPAKA